MTEKRDKSSDRRGSSVEDSNGEDNATKGSDRREIERREHESLVDFERRREACRREEIRRVGSRRQE
ncbi:MAG: hypothetical protein ACI9FB_000139 [Candidatus Azotimanducaceae bacterium]|jgi:hypothetical protein